MGIKLSYIDFMRQFWEVRRAKNISSTQADLYYCLLNECNSRFWPESFQFSNQHICATIGIREKTLIEARSKLKEIGLIDFLPGVTRQKSPTYYLLEYLLKESNKESISGSNQVNNPVTSEKVLTGTYNKTKTNTKILNIPFEVFWDLYDKKRSKDKCASLWEKLSDAERSTALEHIPHYKLSQPDKTYRKDPIRYLKEKAFLDEIVTNEPGLFKHERSAATVYHLERKKIEENSNKQIAYAER